MKKEVDFISVERENYIQLNGKIVFFNVESENECQEC